MLKKICTFLKFEEHSEPITLKKIWVRFIIGLPMTILVWFYYYWSYMFLAVGHLKYENNPIDSITSSLLNISLIVIVHFICWIIYHYLAYRKKKETKLKLLISSLLNGYIPEIIIYVLITTAIIIVGATFAGVGSSSIIGDLIETLKQPFILLLSVNSIATVWITYKSSYIFYRKKGLQSIDLQPLVTTTRRIALIIGNNNYEHYDSLKKQPLNDADAIEERLKTLGAEVVKHTNLNYDGIRRAILDFRQKAKGYDDITFFYAGHGLSYNGKNYLVPTDATPPSTEAELEDLMYAYEQVVKHFADMDGCWNHFFIDACRHTLQFDERGIPTIGDAEKKQLEKWKKRNGKNVCIFFGAAEGESAYNNPKGDNGIFTTALLKHLVQGITLNELIEKVTAETLQISGYKQLPYVTATKVGEYVF